MYVRVYILDVSYDLHTGLHLIAWAELRVHQSLTASTLDGRFGPPLAAGEAEEVKKGHFVDIRGHVMASGL